MFIIKKVNLPYTNFVISYYIKMITNKKLFILIKLDVFFKIKLLFIMKNVKILTAILIIPLALIPSNVFVFFI